MRIFAMPFFREKMLASLGSDRQGSPVGALDPAEDWIQDFDKEMKEREIGRDQDRGRDV
jgi:hypothetical protein